MHDSAWLYDEAEPIPKASLRVSVSPAYTVTAVPASTSLALLAVATSVGLFVAPVDDSVTWLPTIAPIHRLLKLIWALLRVLVKVHVRLSPPITAAAAMVTVPAASVVDTGVPPPSVHTAEVST